MPRRSQRRRSQQRRPLKLRTWRTLKPALLCPVMIQTKSTCYAIAYVRQLEFHLKLNELMPLDEHLSIQDCINHIPKRLLDGDGTIEDISELSSVLQVDGLLLEKDCPLTEMFNRTVFEDAMDRPRYRAKKVKLHSLEEENGDFDQDRYDAFHANFVQQLKLGCVAARITVYPSYLKLKHKEIFYPTNNEWAGNTVSNGHVMLVTGHAYDRKGRLFYECQETAGVNICDDGYVRVYADVVTHFVEMEV